MLDMLLFSSTTSARHCRGWKHSRKWEFGTFWQVLVMLTTLLLAQYTGVRYLGCNEKQKLSAFDECQLLTSVSF